MQIRSPANRSLHAPTTDSTQSCLCDDEHTGCLHAHRHARRHDTAGRAGECVCGGVRTGSCRPQCCCCCAALAWNEVNKATQAIQCVMPLAQQGRAACKSCTVPQRDKDSMRCHLTNCHTRLQVMQRSNCCCCCVLRQADRQMGRQKDGKMGREVSSAQCGRGVRG